MELEVPLAFKTLVKSVMYTFYQPIHLAIMGIMTHYSVLDEDTLIDLLQIDKRQFRSAVYSLRNDRMIKQVSRKEKVAGATVTYTFYYINYYTFINAVNFRLNRVRKDLLTEDRSHVNTAIFQCKYCMKNFYDIDVPVIYNFETNEMLCNQCGGEVTENQAEAPNKSKCLIAKFNEQVEPFYRMIQECQEFTLDPRQLDPDIMDEHIKRAEYARENPNKAADGIRRQFASTGKNLGSVVVSDQKFNITFGDSEEHAQKNQKPYPSWFSRDQRSESPSKVEIQLKADENHLSELLKHETTEANVVLSSSASDSFDEKIDFPDNVETGDLGTINSAEDVMDEEMEEIFHDDSNSPRTNGPNDDHKTETPIITVNGVEYNLDEVTAELMSKMTTEEHERYVYLLNEMYKHVL
ncbi:General transcription factor IIE subunit 1 [Thelohanellus kitauei]|uniref:General transcription factor IIE subunit 1 n=1 Tax=Thelohanellus kitauei TaxID=669202 RepID=A0A0C2IPN9_THEKT|nr:General transcription factor IIE subunit 1 [Thelohanellus kitauei]